MSLIIRNPPSGPVISGVSGLQLRMAENDASMLPLLVASTGDNLPLDLGSSPTGMYVQLNNPSPDRLYGVQFSVSALLAGASAILQTRIQFSYDGGTVWTPGPAVADIGHAITGDDTLRTIVHNTKSVLGSALPGGGIPAGAPSLLARVNCYANNNNFITLAPTGNSTTYFLRLVELAG